MQLIETELEWLFYQLWTKKTARATAFAFIIPDTIIVKQNQPPVWYFTNKDGYFLRKNQHNIRADKMQKAFTQVNFKITEQAAAVAYYYKNTPKQLNGQSVNSQKPFSELRSSLSYHDQIQLLFEYIQVKDLQSYFNFVCSQCPQMKMSPMKLTENTVPNIVQHFVLPKESHNSVIRVQWSPTSVSMEMLTNKSSLYDPKCTLEARSVTFDGLEVYSKREELKNKGFIFENLSKSMWQIYNHIKRNSDIQIIGGQFFFKFNEHDQACLIFATCIKTDKAATILNGNLHIGLGLLANELKFQRHKNIAQGFEQNNKFIQDPQQSTSLVSQLDYALNDLQVKGEMKFTSVPNTTIDQENSELEPFQNRTFLNQDNSFASPKAIENEKPQQKKAADEKIKLNHNFTKEYKRKKDDQDPVSKPIQESRQLSSQKEHRKNSSQTSKCDSCAFCLLQIKQENDILGQKSQVSKTGSYQSQKNKKMSFELTVNQIIKLYEYFENNPEELLSVLTENPNQQLFIEDLYGQVTFNQLKQHMQNQLSSKLIPRPIRQFFQINNFDRYLQMKEDSNFLFTMVKICDQCYSCIKNLLQYQNKPKISQQPLQRVQQKIENPVFDNQSGSRNAEQQRKPSNEDLDVVIANSGEQSGFEENKGGLWEQDASESEESVKPKNGFAMNFSKVKAGKEVIKYNPNLQSSGEIRAYEFLRSKQAIDQVTAEEPSIPNTSNQTTIIQPTPDLQEEKTQLIFYRITSPDGDLSSKNFVREAKYSLQETNFSIEDTNTQDMMSRQEMSTNQTEKRKIKLQERLKKRKSIKTAQQVISFVKTHNMPVVDSIANLNHEKRLSQEASSAFPHPEIGLYKATFCTQSKQAISNRSLDKNEQLPSIQSTSLKRAHLKVLQRFPKGEFRQQIIKEKSTKAKQGFKQIYQPQSILPQMTNWTRESSVWNDHMNVINQVDDEVQQQTALKDFQSAQQMSRQNRTQLKTEQRDQVLQNFGKPQSVAYEMKDQRPFSAKIQFQNVNQPNQFKQMQQNLLSRKSPTKSAKLLQRYKQNHNSHYIQTKNSEALFTSNTVSQIDRNENKKSQSPKNQQFDVGKHGNVKAFLHTKESVMKIYLSNEQKALCNLKQKIAGSRSKSKSKERLQTGKNSVSKNTMSKPPKPNIKRQQVNSNKNAQVSIIDQNDKHEERDAFQSLGLFGMPQSFLGQDLEHIAANADNLIQILQTIKERTRQQLPQASHSEDQKIEIGPQTRHNMFEFPETQTDLLLSNYNDINSQYAACQELQSESQAQSQKQINQISQQQSEIELELNEVSYKMPSDSYLDRVTQSLEHPNESKEDSYKMPADSYLDRVTNALEQPNESQKYEDSFCPDDSEEIHPNKKDEKNWW